MIGSAATATLLGLFAGLAPGPYTTMVAATGLERGFRVAGRIALAPLITDIAPLIAAVFVVSRLNWTALTVLGICGGLVVFTVGIRFLRAHHIPGLPFASSRVAGARVRPPPSVRLRHVITTNLLNPAPWVFWFVVGAPLLLAHARASWSRGAVFLAVFFAVNISSALSLAALAARARSLLAPVAQRRVLFGVGLVLAGVGIAMIWQAFTGDFQAMIEGQELVRDMVDG